MSTGLQMLEQLKEYLATPALFNRVLILKRGLAVCSIFEQEQDLTRFPACVIAGGASYTLDGGCTGSAGVDVVVISPFYGGLEKEVREAHTLLQQTMALLQCDKQGRVLTFGKYFYIPGRVQEISLTDEFLAYEIHLDVKFSFA